MSQTHFDVVVIGGGPGGYVGAIRAVQLGLSVALVEEHKLGGVCLNWGCIPSKALIHQAGIFRSIAELQKMGIKVDSSEFSYLPVYQASRRAADALSKGVAYLMKKNNITLFSGRGRIEGPGEVSVSSGERLKCTNILLATGSRPREIPGFEFDERLVLSSTGALSLEQLPKSMLILGGGAIGVEFAHIMNSFGVKVHLVEMQQSILPLEDREAAGVVARSFTKRGIRIDTGTQALSLTRGERSCVVELKAADGTSESVEVDKVLVVVGRIANTEDIGLEKLAIATERGFVSVGENYRTSAKGVYAIGDMIATPLLAHVASKEAELAVEHMAGHDAPSRIDTMLIPAGVYCEPQLASFGLTEEMAQQKSIPYKAASFPFRGCGKAVAIGQTEGMVKVLFNPQSQEILGCHVVGAEATELIHELLLGKASELLPQDIATMIHAHPTLSETAMEAMRAVQGWAIHV